jgi:penicillin-binding protein 1B
MGYMTKAPAGLRKKKSLLRAPDYFSPYKHPERALQRRNKILEAMVAHGKLSASDAARAEATPVVTQ